MRKLWQIHENVVRNLSKSCVEFSIENLTKSAYNLESYSNFFFSFICCKYKREHIFPIFSELKSRYWSGWIMQIILSHPIFVGHLQSSWKLTAICIVFSSNNCDFSKHLGFKFFVEAAPIFQKELVYFIKL